jgi:hypothetical protein
MVLQQLSYTMRGLELTLEGRFFVKILMFFVD